MGDSSDLQSLTAATEALSLKDTTYFLTSIIFKVEDTIFKVPSYHFEKNEVFADISKLPPPPGEEAEGSSERKPFHLTGISKKEFEAFLAVLYPLTIPLQYNDIATEDWKSVLKLADMWCFIVVRDLAIRELSTSNRLDAVSQILLGINYDVDQWLVSGCKQLILRDTGPRADEARMLGEEITAQIWDIREQKIWSTVGRQPFNMKACIVQAFISPDSTV